MKSIKHESILRQFYIYFLVASVIPLITLFYLLLQLAFGKVDTVQLNIKFLLLIAGILAILGFWGTKSFIVKIVALSNKLKEKQWERIDKEALAELAKGEGEVAQLAKVFSEVTAKLEENIHKLEDAKLTLHRVLSKVGSAITSTENFDALIQFILDTIVEALNAKRGVIFYLEEDKEVLKPKTLSGINIDTIPKQIKMGEEAVGWVAKERKPLFVPLLDEKKSDKLFSPPLIATPLLVHDKLWGVISLNGKKDADNFTEDELKLLSNLASQIAVAFENAKLNMEAERTYFETMSALAMAVEAKDPYSCGHSDSVSKYAINIAKRMGLSQHDLDTLRDAAKLHDIGKIGIIDDILQKSDKLNEEEEAVMHKHPVIGEGIVRPLKTFSHILNPVKHHHEFLDGSGYPDGLKGEQIPLVTRILTVADIFDALTTDRPYRKAMNREEAKKNLQAMVDKGKIDKNVVTTLFSLLSEENKL
jgi:HD-GYP domain-containing protein (c-di-GMP phosphodiesterase class II)